MKFLSVLVADHHPLFAEGIRTVLSVPGQALSCNVTAVARSSEQVEGYLNEYQTDLLLIDPSLPKVEHLEFLGKVKVAHKDLRVLCIGSNNDALDIHQLLKLGADGYLLKTASKDELRTAIREVSEGHTYIGRGVNSVPSESKRPSTADSQHERGFAMKYQLTKRELEIVKYIGQALTNKEIGERLFISDQTVSVHRKNIMRKLKVNSTASMVKLVFEHQLSVANE